MPGVTGNRLWCRGLPALPDFLGGVFWNASMSMRSDVIMKALVYLLAAMFLGGCASYSGRGLESGRAQFADVVQVMGEPALRWQDPDGSLQLAYPRGPMGMHTFMVYLGADGKLVRIVNVLEPGSFAAVQPGMNKAQVVRVLGPSVAGWSTYFAARDELVWEWRYCDPWNETAHFLVLFDATRETVRSTMSLTEAQLGLCNGRGRCTCAH